MHWACNYIGAPYRANAAGPDAFDCWGLVRHVFRHVHGVEFPAVAIEPDAPSNPQNVRAILECARASTMKRAEDGAAPADGDIVIARSRTRLHCGLVIKANGRICVLHAAHDFGVILQPYATAVEGMTAELWRRSG